MLDNSLSTLEKNLERLSENIAENNFSQASENVESINTLLKTIFESGVTLNTSQTNQLDGISLRFSQLTASVTASKSNVSKKLGTHIKTQKKIDIYKSIK